MNELNWTLSTDDLATGDLQFWSWCLTLKIVLVAVGFKWLRAV
uniref:Uncharacterized protein n=1 Tax=Anguilla anguilla TaxID=7936 RepID=A0A0E9RXF5_ANGAN